MYSLTTNGFELKKLWTNKLRNFFYLFSVAAFLLFTTGCTGPQLKEIVFSDGKMASVEKNDPDEINIPPEHVLLFESDGTPQHPCYVEKKLNEEGKIDTSHCEKESYILKEHWTLNPIYYSQYIENIFKKMDEYFNCNEEDESNPYCGIKALAPSKKRIMFYVHGGLNSSTSSLKNVTEKFWINPKKPNDTSSQIDLNPDDFKAQYQAIKEAGYFPIFINWRSGLLTTYLEHLFRIRQGENVNLFKGIVTSPVYLGVDIARSIVRAPLVLGSLWWNEFKNIPKVNNAIGKKPPQSESQLLTAKIFCENKTEDEYPRCMVDLIGKKKWADFECGINGHGEDKNAYKKCIKNTATRICNKDQNCKNDFFVDMKFAELVCSDYNYGSDEYGEDREAYKACLAKKICDNDLNCVENFLDKKESIFSNNKENYFFDEPLPLYNCSPRNPEDEKSFKIELSNLNKPSVQIGKDKRHCGEMFDATLQYINPITLPVRTAVAPLLDNFGTSSWSNMLRRVDLLFHHDRDFHPLAKNKDKEKAWVNFSDKSSYKAQPSGGLSVFMERLVEKYKNETLKKFKDKTSEKPKDWEIALVGHSAGTIVLNEIIRNFGSRELSSTNPKLSAQISDLCEKNTEIKEVKSLCQTVNEGVLPFNKIVYMASASTIGHFESTVVPYLQENPQTNFYNLTLHPTAERRETNIYNFSPLGSLLVWIDEFLSTPLTHRDRTLGRFDNFYPALHTLPNNVLDQVNIKSFRLGEEFLDTDPQEHSEFNGRFQFWREYCWDTSKEPIEDIRTSSTASRDEQIKKWNKVVMDPRNCMKFRKEDFSKDKPFYHNY